jgi:hypothetical protein
MAFIESAFDLTCGQMKRLMLPLCLLVICVNELGAQSWRDHRARLCFIRPEDSGAINGLQSWVRIQSYEFGLSGTQSGCLFVDPAQNSDLIVTSTIPYDPHSTNEIACKSPLIKLNLQLDEDRTFVIFAARRKGIPICGWRIEPIAPSKNANSKKNP